MQLNSDIVALGQAVVEAQNPDTRKQYDIILMLMLEEMKKLNVVANELLIPSFN